ncbi:hypothetical protein C8R43DRAFT_1108333 [Mycena crocata]|nr:hypothetical protein C8R43DRAFT_1108333 [Mycena crocata]
MSTSTGRANMEFMFNYNLPPIRLSSSLHATSLPKVWPMKRSRLCWTWDYVYLMSMESNSMTLVKMRKTTTKKTSQARMVSLSTSKKNLDDFCHPVASALQIRPPNFHSIFMWGNRERDVQPFDHGLPFVLDGFALTLRRLRDKLLIKEAEQLQGVLRHCPVLRTWQIYPPDFQGNDLLEEKMSRVLLSGSFTPGICTTLGFEKTQPRCVPGHDARRFPWTSLVAKLGPRATTLDIPASLSVLRAQPFLAPRRSARLKQIPGIDKSRRSQGPNRAHADELRISPAIPPMRAPNRIAQDKGPGSSVVG